MQRVNEHLLSCVQYSSSCLTVQCSLLMPVPFLAALFATHLAAKQRVNEHLLSYVQYSSSCLTVQCSLLMPVSSLAALFATHLATKQRVIDLFVVLRAIFFIMPHSAVQLANARAVSCSPVRYASQQCNVLTNICCLTCNILHHASQCDAAV